MEFDLTHLLQRKTFYFPIAYSNYYLGGPLAQLQQRLLSPGSTFLDIGSSLGWFALNAAKLVGPSGRVVAFEPDPQSFQCVRRSAKLNDFHQLHVHNLAISDSPGNLTFYRDPHGLRSSLVDSGYREQLSVEVSSLDALANAQKLDISTVVLVKIDVEGAEVAAVRGMLRALEDWRLPTVWCEVRGPNGSSRAPNTLSAVRAELEPLGYRAFKFDDDGDVRALADEDIAKSGSQDVLFATSSNL